MKRRSLLALLGGTSLGSSLILGSGAFQSTTVSRSVSVAVVGDSEAYLTLQYPQDKVSFDCEESVQLKIRNRTGQPLDALTVKFSLGPGKIKVLNTSGPGTYNTTSADTISLDSGTLPAGEKTTVTVTVGEFAGQGETDLVFGVEASGDSIAIETTSTRTVPLDFNCPQTPTFGKGLACPVSVNQSLPSPSFSPSVSSPGISVSDSDCADLRFDQKQLRSVEDSIDFSQGPSGIRSALNGKSEINVTKRVLSDDLSSNRIKPTPDDPGELVLGGSNKQARIGTTKDDKVAAVPGKVKIKNDSTVVGAIEADGKFKIKGGSAVAGDVTTDTVETVANSLLLGSLTATNGGNAISITSGGLICGGVDAAGKVSQIKQSRVNGPVTAGGDISEINESTVVGKVKTETGSKGDISVKSNSTISGDVLADGAIPEVKESDVTGSLESGGDISSVKQSTVGGDVTTTSGSSGDVTVEDSTVGGSITADGAVSAVKSNSEVGGSVTASGNIPELKNSVVVGDVTTTSGSGGSMTIEGATVGGAINADGAISAIKSGCEIDGNVTANGDVSAIKGSAVGGNVTTVDGSDGTVKVKNSEIGGAVDADGAISAIKSGSKIADGVTAGGNISSIKGSNIGGGVTTTDGGNVTVESSTVGGSMDIAGVVSAIKASEVDGRIEAAEIDQLKGARISGGVTATDGTATAITIARNNRKSVVCGDVETNGPVEKIKNSQVTGSVKAARVGKLKGEKTEVGGNVETTDAKADLKIKSESTVFGSVDAAGPIPEINSSTVEGNVTAGGKIKIKSSEVCTATGASLETKNEGKVTVNSNSTVGGSIDATGPIEKIKNSIVEGSVTSNGYAKIKGSNSTIKGSVTTKNGGSVTVESATVEGDIDADGKITKIKDANVTGDVTAGGPVEKIKSTKNVGAVTAGGDVKIKNSTTGAITTTDNGNLILKSSSTVEGSITLSGKVTKIKGSTVEGNVTSDGEIKKIKNSTIEGRVDAGGDVLLKGSTTVKGNVVAEGSVSLSGSATVEGKIKENQ